MKPKRKKKFKVFKGFTKETKFQKISHFIPLIVVSLCLYLYTYHNIPLYDPKALFGGIVPFLSVGGLIYLFVYTAIDPSDLTDNVKANKVFAPLVFIAILSYAHFKLKLSFFGSLYPYYGALGFASLFTFIFMYSSQYFQPDLDVYGSRPGMTHFPTGRWIGMFKWGRFLRWLFKPLTIVWFHFWTPYAFMFTHRGISHYPVTSTWLRVGYVWVTFSTINLIVQALGLNITGINLIINWCEWFFPWHPQFMSPSFILYCLPIYLTDFIHISVDYIEAVIKGKPYCSPRHPRGFFAKIIEEIKKNF